MTVSGMPSSGKTAACPTSALWVETSPTRWESIIGGMSSVVPQRAVTSEFWGILHAAAGWRALDLLAPPIPLKAIQQQPQSTILARLSVHLPGVKAFKGS